MTDEDLIARLFDSDAASALTNEAARRIEALVRERDRYLRHLTAGAESLNAYKARAERLEAALRKLACKCPSNCDWEHDDICPSWIALDALRAGDP